jgi:hypothetical protein
LLAVLDALNQATCQHCPAEAGRRTRHTDRGSGSRAHIFIRYTDRQADMGPDTSTVSVENSGDNSMSENIIGPFKTEIISFLGPWKSMAKVE